MGQPAHKRWVSRFAFRLQSNGLNVIIDQEILKFGDSLSYFMEKAIGLSDFVLLICTTNYKKRADERTGGVGYEQDLMTAEKLMARHDSKFIPVLRKGDWYNALPRWLAGRLGVDLRGADDKRAQDNFQNLVEHLLHSPLARRRKV